MVNMLCGFAIDIVIFAVITFCYRYRKARQRAKRSSSQSPKEETKFKSDRFCFLLLCASLAFGIAATRP